MTRWNRLLAMTSDERRLRLRALVVLFRVRVALWTLSFARVRARVERAARPSIPGGSSPGWGPRDVDRSVRSAARFVPGATCLVRAMAAQVLLGRAGIRGTLTLGIARDRRGGVLAHAWVQCEDGAVVGDRGSEKFVPVPVS